MDKQNNEEMETLVVEQLPQAVQREVIDENTKKPYKLITRDEAITEILQIVKKLEGKL